MTRRTFRTRLRAVCVKFACAWVGVASAGCAVLTIDVDVYKGPLSNQPDVQMEQVSGMAMGAKPLLLNLRDKLEVPDDKSLDPPDYHRRDWRNGTSPKKPKHVPSWIRDDSNFDSEHAVRVNAVLYLYEDEVPGLSPDLEGLWREVIAAMDDYRDSDARFRLDPQTAGMEWDEVAKGMLRRSALPKYLRSYVEPGSDDDPVDLERGENQLNHVLFGAHADSLKSAYRTFWIPEKDTGFRRWFSLVHANDALHTMAGTINEAEPKTPDEKFTIAAWESEDSDELTDNARSNITYTLLAEPSLVRIHADLLFGNSESSEKEFFVARITGIARAFLDNRDALSRLFRASAKAVAVFEAESASEVDKAFVDQASETLVAIVNPLHLLAMLKLAETQPDRVPDSVAKLRQAIESTGSDLFSASNTADPVFEEFGASEKGRFWKDLTDKTRRLLKDQLDLNPQATAFALLQAHDAFSGRMLFDGMDDEAILQSAGLGSSNDSLTVRQYGLTSGRQTYTSKATETATRLDLFSSRFIDESQGIFFSINAGGLEGGRPKEGVARLIEEYVNARLENPQRPDSPLVEHARDRLLDGLIHFTQKVSTLANYTQLLDTTRDPGSRAYGRVLQAVANSITFQIDELRAAKNFDNRFRGGRADAESRALERARQSARAMRAAAVVDAIIASLATKADTVQALEESKKQVEAAVIALRFTAGDLDESLEPKAVLDALIVALGAQINTARADNQVDNADDLARAYAYLTDGERQKAMVEAAVDDVPSTKPQQYLDFWRTAENKKAQSIETELADARERKATLDAVRQEVEQRRDAIVGLADPGAAVDAVIDILKREISNHQAGTPANNALSSAIARIEAGRAQLADLTAFDKSDPKDAREVLDELIATLEMERILVLRQKGDASSIGEALKAARAYRSDMVYIRPSSAYLRSSFPSTSLQSDPELLWQNMLKDHGDRTASSFWGESIVNPRSGRDAARITADIDKQFWQNINRVRVAGGGNTNYVIAKDDIGNWYVKSYSADPKDIIKSARNLALFSMSPSMGANLLDRAEQRDAATPGAPEATERSVTPVQRQFEKFRNNFDEQVEADHAQLEAAIVGATPTAPVLTTTIQNQWAAAGVPVESDSPFASALNQSAVILKPSEEETDDLSQQIVDRLRAVKEFRASVAAGVGQIPAADRTAYDTEQEQANAQAQVLRDLEKERDDLETQLQQQQGAVERHRSDATYFRDRSSDLTKRANDVREADLDRANELDAEAAADATKADEADKLATTEDAALAKTQTELDAKQVEVKTGQDDAQREAEEAAAAKAKYDQTLAHANAAREALDRIVNALLNRFIDRRLLALDNYANAITIFGSPDDK